MLNSLGQLSLERFRVIKPMLLLLYLTFEGPTPRQTLRALLWPNARQPDASLRVALHELRKHGIQAVQGNAVLTCSVPCDAVLLLASRGQAALSAYKGVFLQGVSLSDVSTEFEEWVDHQRARLALHVQTEALLVAENSAPIEAAQLAEYLYRLPGAPSAEPDVLRRLQALSLPGSSLEVELRAELQEVTGPEATPAPRPAHRRMLGRAEELDRLLAWVERPDTRIAAVSGPGGIGKSTLLRELLRELTLTGRRVTLVDAEGVAAPGDLLPRLASARVPGQAVQGTWAGLRPLFGEHPVILLDGLDDLKDMSGLLMSLRSELPEARWILAGRRQIGRQVREYERHSADQPGAEAALLITLSGLDTPAPGAELPEITASSGVALFVREATRVRRDFQLTDDNAEVLAGLVRRLVGHPLALALAASWLRVEALEGVYARVLQDAGTLSSPGGDGDGRRGLLLVAQRSWDLLSPEEQTAALCLSVGPDFDPLDAPALGVRTNLVDQLVEHSFLETFQPGSERLRFSPALSGLLYSQVQTQPLIHAEAQRRYAEHYLGWFSLQVPEAPGVDVERDVLRRAISVALASGTLEAAVLDRFLAHYDRRGLLSSGTDVFASIADEAEEVHAPEEVQASAQVGCMWLAYRSGRLLDAQARAAHFLQGPLASAPVSRMKALNTLASVRATQGQRQIAAEMQAQALELAVWAGDQGRIAGYRLNLLSTLSFLGDAESMRRELAAMELLLLQLPVTLGLELKQMMLQIALTLPEADYALLRDRAIALSQEGEETGHTSVATASRLYLCKINLKLGRFSEVKPLLASLRAEAGVLEGTDIGVEFLLTELDYLYSSGRSTEARDLFRRMLPVLTLRSNPWELIEAFLIVAPDAHLSQVPAASRLRGRVANDRNVHFDQRRRAGAETTEWAAGSGSEAFNLDELKLWLSSQAL